MFTEELNKYSQSVGTFAVRSWPSASAPGERVGGTWPRIGVAAGLLAGVVALLLVLATTGDRARPPPSRPPGHGAPDDSGGSSA